MFGFGIIQFILLSIVLGIIYMFVSFGTMGDPQRAKEIMEPIVNWVLLIGLSPWIVYYGAKLIKGMFSAGSGSSKIRAESAIAKGSLKRTDSFSNTDFGAEVLKRVETQCELRDLELEFSDLLEVDVKGRHSFSVGIHTADFDGYEQYFGDRFAVVFTMPSKGKGPCVIETVWHPNGYQDSLDSYVSGDIEELADWLFEEVVTWNEQIKDKLSASLSEDEMLMVASRL